MEICMPMGFGKRHKFIFLLISQPIFYRFCFNVTHIIKNLPYSNIFNIRIWNWMNMAYSNIQKMVIHWKPYLRVLRTSFWKERKLNIWWANISSCGVEILWDTFNRGLNLPNFNAVYFSIPRCLLLDTVERSRDRPRSPVDVQSEHRNELLQNYKAARWGEP